MLVPWQHMNPDRVYGIIKRKVDILQKAPPIGCKMMSSQMYVSASKSPGRTIRSQQAERI